MATIEEQLNQLKQDKTVLVQNLVEKGIEASDDETFTELVPKVAEIQSGGNIEEYISSTTDYYPNGSHYVSDQIVYRIKKLPELDFTSSKNTTPLAELFSGLRVIEKIPVIKINEETIIYNINSIFSNCEKLIDITNLLNIIKGKKIKFMGHTFYRCEKLKDFSFLSELDTSEIPYLSSTFYGCKMTELSLFNTENVTKMDYAFSQCNELLTIPQFNTAKCINFDSTFSNCTNLNSLPELDFSSIANLNDFLRGTKEKLTSLGGFKNLGFSYSQTKANYSTYTLDLSTCPVLAKESVLNVFNDLYDLNETYEGKPTPYTQQIKLHADVKALLSEEDIAIATNKGWTVV